MNIDNITSDGIALSNNGKEMLIKVYEQEIKRLKEEYMILQNASDKVEEEKDKEIKRLKDDNNELRELLEYKNDRIERLNNIINGMEKFFQYAYDNEVRPLNDRKVSVWTICLDKLQELKGSDKE